MVKSKKDSGNIVLGTLGVVGVLLLVVVLSVGGWFAYWAITRANTNQNTDILQHSYSVQIADIASARQKITELTSLPADSAQRKAIVNIVCGNIADINHAQASNLPADLASFAAQECSE